MCHHMVTLGVVSLREGGEASIARSGVRVGEVHSSLVGAPSQFLS